MAFFIRIDTSERQGYDYRYTSSIKPFIRRHNYIRQKNPAQNRKGFEPAVTSENQSSLIYYLCKESMQNVNSQQMQKRDYE